MQLNLGLPVLLALDTQQQLAPAALKFSLAAAATIAISKNSLNSCFCVSSAPNWKSGQQSLGHMLFLAAKKARKASTSLFSYPLLHNTGEGNGNPLQYSCLENPWTEEPGGIQSIGSQRVGHDWSNLACMISTHLIILVCLAQMWQSKMSPKIAKY